MAYNYGNYALQLHDLFEGVSLAMKKDDEDELSQPIQTLSAFIKAHKQETEIKVLVKKQIKDLSEDALLQGSLKTTVINALKAALGVKNVLISTSANAKGVTPQTNEDKLYAEVKDAVMQGQTTITLTAICRWLGVNNQSAAKTLMDKVAAQLKAEEIAEIVIGTSNQWLFKSLESDKNNPEKEPKHFISTTTPKTSASLNEDQKLYDEIKKAIEQGRTTITLNDIFQWMGVGSLTGREYLMNKIANRLEAEGFAKATERKLSNWTFERLKDNIAQPSSAISKGDLPLFARK